MSKVKYQLDRPASVVLITDRDLTADSLVALSSRHEIPSFTMGKQHRQFAAISTQRGGILTVHASIISMGWFVRVSSVLKRTAFDLPLLLI